MRATHWQGALELGLPRFDVPDAKSIRKAIGNVETALRSVGELEGTEDDDVAGATKEMEEAVYEIEGMVDDLQKEFSIASVEIEELINFSAELLATLGAIWVQGNQIADLKDWCAEHATGQYEFWSYNKQWALWLKEDLDRVQFKLRWSDEIEIDFDS